MRKCGCHSHNGLLLSPEGLAARVEDEQVDLEDELAYLDSRVSVSGLRRDENHWVDALIEEQYRRFDNGS